MLRSLPSEEPEIDSDRFLLGREAGIGSNTFAFGADATESPGGDDAEGRRAAGQPAGKATPEREIVVSY